VGASLIDFSHSPLPLWDHQKIGAQRLVDFPALAIFDEVGLGKSAMVTVAACELYEQRVIDTLMVITPAFARSVWASPDPLLGEWAKHAWKHLPYVLHEYSAKHPTIPDTPIRSAHLDVLVTNYEIVRRDNHLRTLLHWLRQRRALLVLDESWSIESPQADQSRACYSLARAARRVVVLNATPGAPEKTYTQFVTIKPDLFPCRNWFAWRARYCRMGGWQNKLVVGYEHMDQYTALTAPYVLRRTAAECLDLPEELPALTLEARLTDATWAAYCAMRDEFVVWLQTGGVSVAAQAGTRALRMSQILAGFIGGVEEDEEIEGETAQRPPVSKVRSIGTEKLDAVLAWLDTHARIGKSVIWCRFKPEMDRFTAALQQQYGNAHVYELRGQQDPVARDAAKRRFAPGVGLADAPSEAAYLVGHPAAGGAGLNLAGARYAVTASRNHSLRQYTQGRGRVQRPGQTERVRFVDVIAVGPAGQRTYDHLIVEALRANQNIADWTIEQWLTHLSQSA
jgi:hypothetical protein